MSDYKTVLEELGYTVIDRGNEYRAQPIYRQSDNSSSLRVLKDTGFWQDFGMGISGRFEELIKITLKLPSVEDVQAWLEKNNIKLQKPLRQKPIIKGMKIYPPETLNKLIPKHDYWLNRGVSYETLQTFKGGLITHGKMAGRYAFPIFNSKNQIIGFAGRDVFNNKDDRPKWKLIGNKMDWNYPFFVNYADVKQKKEVILVESIGDCLALYDAGITNTLVLFGLLLGNKRLITLLRFGLEKIIIALNNDSTEGINMGQNAAKNIYELLIDYFDIDQVIMKPPTKNDFGDMSQEEILEWYGN